MSRSLALSSRLCEQCAQEGQVTVADYVCQLEETSLQGPLLGDPDYWPTQQPGWQALCEDHYHRLPPDCTLDYVPTGEDDAPAF